MKMNFFEVLKCLTHNQLQELLTETFGANAKYCTVDEIPLYKLLAKIPKEKCPICDVEFIQQTQGGHKDNEGHWVCLNCYWNT
jgi:hypothetical protein